MRFLVQNGGGLADMLQMLPALSDARRVMPQAVFDVIVDERWRDLVCRHPAVDKVYTLPVRRWRHYVVSALSSEDSQRIRKQLRKYNYDWVFDLYGGWVSAAFARSVRCACAGFAAKSAKKLSSAVLYNYCHPYAPDVHRVEQIRQMLSHCLGYDSTAMPLDYGLSIDQFASRTARADNLCLMLGAKERDVRLPFDQSCTLVGTLAHLGMPLRLVWRDENSGAFARQVADHSPFAELTPKLKLTGIAAVLADARAIVTVDNGLSHLAAALGVPTVRLQQIGADETGVAYGGKQMSVTLQDGWQAADVLNAVGQLLAQPAVVAAPGAPASVVE